MEVKPKLEWKHSFCSVGSDELDGGIDSGSDEEDDQDMWPAFMMNSDAMNSEEPMIPLSA